MVGESHVDGAERSGALGRVSAMGGALCAAQNLPAARHVLDTAEKRCTSAASDATLTAWRAALEQT